MRLWRLVRRPFLAFDGSGAERSGARWTSPGRPVVHFASEAALAVLIVLRYLPRDLMGIDQDYLLGWTQTDEQPEDISFTPDPVEKRARGDDWLVSNRSLFASVPSAVLPEARLILMNPRHPSAGSIAPLTARPFSFEQCLDLPPLPT